MNQPKYQIGQEVWAARTTSHEERVVCPDCGGTLHLTVTLFDGTVHTIPCETCSRGWQGPCGILPKSVYGPKVEKIVIGGLDIWPGKEPEYRISAGCNSAYCFKESQLFTSQDKAESKAHQLAIERDEEEVARLKQKEKPAKSWAWHVHYYRSIIRRAKEEIERATVKLSIAKELEKKSTPKPGPPPA